MSRRGGRAGCGFDGFSDDEEVGRGRGRGRGSQQGRGRGRGGRRGGYRGGRGRGSYSLRGRGEAFSSLIHKYEKQSRQSNLTPVNEH